MGTPDSASASTSRWTVRTETSSSRARALAVSWPRVCSRSRSDTRREARIAAHRTPKHAAPWHIRDEPQLASAAGLAPIGGAALGDEANRDPGPVEEARRDRCALAGLA